MKKRITKEEVKLPEGKLMTRKEALKRSGYMALSAATMMLLMNTNAQATSPAPPSSGTPSKPNQSDGIWND